MRKYLLGLAACCGLLASAADAPLMELPEGCTRKAYSLECKSLYPFMGYLVDSDTDGAQRELYFKDDKVYWKNPIVNIVKGSYIEGTLADGKITFTFPQPIQATEKETGTVVVYANRMTLNPASTSDFPEHDYIPDKASNTVSFTIAADGTITQDESEALIGLTLNDEFFFYGDRDIKLTIPQTKLVNIPDGVEMKPYAMAYGRGFSYLQRAYIGFDGNDVYLKGFWNEYDGTEEATIKGEIKGDKIVFPSDQYVGRFNDNSVYFYLYTCGGEYEANKYGVSSYYKDDELVLDYDAATGKIGTTEQALILKRGTGESLGINWLQHWDEPSFAPVDDSSITRPADPMITYAEYSSDEGFNCWFVNIIPKDMDAFATKLDRSKMSYRIFLDDEPYVFTKEIYGNARWGLQEEGEWVPFEFASSVDEYWGETWDVWIYCSGENKDLAVQVRYVDGDREERSNIIYYKGESKYDKDFYGGIANVSTDAVPVAVDYYDLTGRRVAAPTAGHMYIRLTTRADGSRFCEKFIMK